MAAETLDAVIIGLDDIDRRGAEADDGFVGTERELGATHVHARERVKVVPRDEQVAVSRSGVLAV